MRPLSMTYFIVAKEAISNALLLSIKDNGRLLESIKSKVQQFDRIVICLHEDTLIILTKECLKNMKYFKSVLKCSVRKAWNYFIYFEYFEKKNEL